MGHYKQTEPMYQQRIKIVNFVKERPGCSTDEVAAAFGMSGAAMRHRLRYIAERHCLTMEMVSTCTVVSSKKATWYYLRDFDVPAHVRRDEERKALVKASQKRGSPYRGGNIPEIFLMHQPALPVVAKNAKVVRNDKDGRMPIKDQGGQGSGRHSSWVNSNAPLSTLAL